MSEEQTPYGDALAAKVADYRRRRRLLDKSLADVIALGHALFPVSRRVRFWLQGAEHTGTVAKLVTCGETAGRLVLNVVDDADLGGHLIDAVDATPIGEED